MLKISTVDKVREFVENARGEQILSWHILFLLLLYRYIVFIVRRIPFARGILQELVSRPTISTNLQHIILCTINALRTKCSRRIIIILYRVIFTQAQNFFLNCVRKVRSRCLESALAIIRVVINCIIINYNAIFVYTIQQFKNYSFEFLISVRQKLQKNDPNEAPQ